MSITTREAALVLGVTEDRVRELQAEGNLPANIPDDYFDAVINFRIQMEQALRRKVDRAAGVPDAEH